MGSPLCRRGILYGASLGRLLGTVKKEQEEMTFWEILIVIGVIVIPLILSIWMTLWTVEKRGRGPSPYKRPDQQQPARPENLSENRDQPRT
ncbi:MAG TPA: hypothetical protein VHG52_05705 [Thermomicrobiales bacterium]|nr:hypothetical protein [Thermomicrobiales bacterium]